MFITIAVVPKLHVGAEGQADQVGLSLSPAPSKASGTKLLLNYCLKGGWMKTERREGGRRRRKRKEGGRKGEREGG